MEIPVFFLDSSNPAPFHTLDEDTSRHVVQVLRMKTLDRLHLTDGAGNLYTAEIMDAHKKRCTVNLVSQRSIARPERSVSIGISLLKNTSRFEWFLEKATEIGVSEIIPLLGERTERQHFRHERMKQILISAMIQSKQAWLPKLHAPTTSAELIPAAVYTTKLIAHCEEGPSKTIADFRKSSAVQILIGPEGDFTPSEIELAYQHKYQPVTLGQNRLRTETAGVVAATILCL